MNAFSVVAQFEQSVSKYAGAKFGVAVNTCTSALFLCLAYMRSQRPSVAHVAVPARTFVSVPMAVIHAGFKVEFRDLSWGGVYHLDPLPIVDGALRFRRGMYRGGLHCVSFHARKHLNIGEGGMVLTDDEKAVEWLKKARYSGRGGSYAIEDIDMLGWQMYMTPEKAARGLHLMEYIEDELPDQVVEYPDLRKAKVFQ